MQGSVYSYILHVRWLQLAVVACCVVIGSSCFELPEEDEAIIEGIVKDAEIGDSLSDILVSSQPSTERVRTDAEGRYELRTILIPEATRFTVHAFGAGYMPDSAVVTAEPSEVEVLDFALTRKKAILDVTPRLLDFGKRATSKIVVVNNIGEQSDFSWEVGVPDEAWISVDPMTGEVSGGGKPFLVNVDRSMVCDNPGPGPYDTMVTVVTAPDVGIAEVMVMMEVEGC